jgi:hypothetical protein
MISDMSEVHLIQDASSDQFVVEPYALHTEPILSSDRSHILNIISTLKQEMNRIRSSETPSVVSSDVLKDNA